MKGSDGNALVKSLGGGGGGRCEKSGMLYQGEVQDVLVYCSEIWVITVEMINTLDGLHIVFDRGIVRMCHRREEEVMWV